MKRFKSKFFVIIITFILSYAAIFNIVNANIKITFPNPTNFKYINDYIGIMSNEDTNRIVSIGKELEDKTTAQAIIVIINSTEGIPIEEYSNKLFRQWGIGQSKSDNGLLIVLAIEDKAWRVEVGRGLEGAIPDALSNKIMIDIGKPNFISGNYSKGLLESYSSLCDNIAKEYGVILSKSMNIQLPSNSRSESKNNTTLITILIVGLIFFDLLLNRGRVMSSLLNLIFWSNFFNGGGPRGGGGSSGGGSGFGGFGGGSSNGGGSSGEW